MRAGFAILIALLLLGCSEVTIHENISITNTTNTTAPIVVERLEASELTIGFMVPGSLVLEGLRNDVVVFEDGVARRIVDDDEFTLITEPGSFAINVEAEGRGVLTANDKPVYDDTRRSRTAFDDVIILSDVHRPESAGTPEDWVRENLDEKDPIADPDSLLDWSVFERDVEFDPVPYSLPLLFNQEQEFMIYDSQGLREVTASGNVTFSTDAIMAKSPVHLSKAANLYFRCPTGCELKAVPDGFRSFQNVRIGNDVVTLDDLEGFTEELDPGSYKVWFPSGQVTVSGFGYAALTPVTYFEPYDYRRVDKAETLVMARSPVIDSDGEVDMEWSGDELEIIGVTLTPVE